MAALVPSLKMARASTVDLRKARRGALGAPLKQPKGSVHPGPKTSPEGALVLHEDGVWGVKRGLSTSKGTWTLWAHDFRPLGVNGPHLGAQGAPRNTQPHTHTHTREAHARNWLEGTFKHQTSNRQLDCQAHGPDWT